MFLLWHEFWERYNCGKFSLSSFRWQMQNMENKSIFILQVRTGGSVWWEWYWFKASQNGEPFVNRESRERTHENVNISVVSIALQNWCFCVQFDPHGCIWIHRRIVNYKNQLIQLVCVPRFNVVRLRFVPSTDRTNIFCLLSHLVASSRVLPFGFCRLLFAFTCFILCSAYEFICQIIDNFSSYFRSRSHKILWRHMFLCMRIIHFSIGFIKKKSPRKC